MRIIRELENIPAADGSKDPSEKGLPEAFNEWVGMGKRPPMVSGFNRDMMKAAREDTGLSVDERVMLVQTGVSVCEREATVGQWTRRS